MVLIGWNSKKATETFKHLSVTSLGTKKHEISTALRKINRFTLNSAFSRIPAKVAPSSTNFYLRFLRCFQKTILFSQLSLIFLEVLSLFTVREFRNTSLK